MLRKILLALIGLAVVLLLDSLGMPARATLHETAVYQWDYPHLAQTQRACKKIILRPKLQTPSTPLGQHRVQIRSEIVDDGYCAGSF
jgi:hypothetical protein